MSITNLANRTRVIYTLQIGVKKKKKNILSMLLNKQHDNKTTITSRQTIFPKYPTHSKYPIRKQFFFVFFSSNNNYI